MSEKTILIVDDERPIVNLVKLYCENEGYHVEVAYDGHEGVRLSRALRPALVVLDLMLPGLDGFEVCRTLRRESDVPIIMLTARTDDVDKIVGLELGADDYLGKPFNPRELLARIRAILRRAEVTAARAGERRRRSFSGFVIDLDARSVERADGTSVPLPSAEFDLLAR